MPQVAGKKVDVHIPGPWDVDGVVEEPLTYFDFPGVLGGHSLYFNPTGTKMYVGGSDVSQLLTFSLSTPWYPSTAITTTETLDFFFFSSGVFFKEDGTRLYAVLTISGVSRVRSYTLSTPWDISTATYDSKEFTPQVNGMSGIFIDPTGGRLFLSNQQFDRVYQYDMSTAWDITTAPVTSNDFIDVGNISGDNGPGGLFFSADGLNMYFGYLPTYNPGDEALTGRVVQTEFVSTYDVTVSVVRQTKTDLDPIDTTAPVSRQPFSVTGLFIRSDGSQMFVAADGNIDGVIRYAFQP